MHITCGAKRACSVLGLKERGIYSCSELVQVVRSAVARFHGLKNEAFYKCNVLFCFMAYRTRNITFEARLFIASEERRRKGLLCRQARSASAARGVSELFACVVGVWRGRKREFYAREKREDRASRAPRVSLSPKTPFPFKRLPRRLASWQH